MNEPEFKAAKDMARRERCLPDAMYADMTGEQMEEKVSKKQPEQLEFL